ncbi:MAG: hypothetical protein LBK52_07105, partial [Deltaproteobacteria bacterium]|nr:hypothetical protein [Deltaproteobacteria bacterium]
HILTAGKEGRRLAYFACSDREKCGIRFKDKFGVPGEPHAGWEDYKKQLCPECGMTLTRSVSTRDGRKQVLWTCNSEEGCRSRFADKDGAPGDLMSRIIFTDQLCPDCHNSLNQLKMRRGDSEFITWVCRNRQDCGARFRDRNGEVGDRMNSQTVTSYLCPECQKNLEYFKGVKNRTFYSYWMCTDHEACGVKYHDNSGQPGEPYPKMRHSLYTCEICGETLIYITKTGLNGYKFWGCSSDSCRANFFDDDGVPGRLKNTKKFQSANQLRRCPHCNSLLGKVRGIPDDPLSVFLQCRNTACRKTFELIDERPVFNTNEVRGAYRAENKSIGTFGEVFQQQDTEGKLSKLMNRPKSNRHPAQADAPPAGEKAEKDSASEASELTGTSPAAPEPPEAEGPVTAAEAEAAPEFSEAEAPVAAAPVMAEEVPASAGASGGNGSDGESQVSGAAASADSGSNGESQVSGPAADQESWGILRQRAKDQADDKGSLWEAFLSGGQSS